MRRNTQPNLVILQLIRNLILTAGLTLGMGASVSAFAEPETLDQDGPAFLEKFPVLKQHLFEEPKTPVRLGIGATPFSFSKDRYFFGASFLQIHWVTRNWDLELLNLSVTFTIPQESFAKSRHFTLRSSPKIVLFKGFSAGPVIGAEFVSFPDVRARLLKSSYASPYEEFSTSGLIYGAALSEIVQLGPENTLKINQVFYKQSYSPTDAGDGWVYNFENSDLELDPDKTPIKPNYVFLLEFSLLF